MGRYDAGEGPSSVSRTISLLPGDDEKCRALVYRLGVDRLRIPVESDTVLAFALLAVGQTEVWLVGNVGGSKAVMAPLLAGTALSLAWRRRAPVVPPLVLGIAFAAAMVVFATTDRWPGQPQSLSMLAVWVVTAYSVAAHGELPVAGFGLVVVGGLSVVRAGLDPAMEWEPLSSLFVLIPWGAGLALRRHRRQAAELLTLARELEREREERARAAVVEERTRIARELHDVVAHGVSVIAVQSDAAEAALERDPERAREPLAAIKHTAREVLVEMRRLLGILRQAEDELGLAPLPGMGRLASLVEEVRRAGLPVELDIQGEPRPLPAGLDLSVYRIVQEGLTNVRRHAGAATARVEIRYGDAELDVAVLDDGSGSGNGSDAGHGLIGIQERVALLGGELRAGRQDGGGHELRVRVPLGRRSG